MFFWHCWANLHKNLWKCCNSSHLKHRCRFLHLRQSLCSGLTEGHATISTNHSSGQLLLAVLHVGDIPATSEQSCFHGVSSSILRFETFVRTIWLLKSVLTVSRKRHLTCLSSFTSLFVMFCVSESPPIYRTSSALKGRRAPWVRRIQDV